jgi:hypothetical protein
MALQRGAAPWLNLAVCPAAACLPINGAKVPYAIARRAVRPQGGQLIVVPLDQYSRHGSEV